MSGKKIEMEKYKALFTQLIQAKASVEGTDIASAEARLNAMHFDEPAEVLIRNMVAEEAVKKEAAEKAAQERIA